MLRKVIFAVWLGGVALSFYALWAYSLAPGKPAAAPARWPAASQLVRRPGLPTVVLFFHPACPCSRATAEELSRLLTACPDKASINVVLVRPQPGETSPLRGLGDLNLVLGGEEEVRLFGAATSGQVLVYDPDGRLSFAGGITPARGHQGDNGGFDAVRSALLGRELCGEKYPVYGCGLRLP